MALEKLGQEKRLTETEQIAGSNESEMNSGSGSDESSYMLCNETEDSRDLNEKIYVCNEESDVNLCCEKQNNTEFNEHRCVSSERGKDEPSNNNGHETEENRCFRANMCLINSGYGTTDEDENNNNMKTYVDYCIQGQKVIPTNALYCEEILHSDDSSSKTDTGDRSDIIGYNSDSELDNLYDLDDSVNDPDWTVETTKRGKRELSSSDDSSFEEIKKNKNLPKKMKRKSKPQTKKFQTLKGTENHSTVNINPEKITNELDQSVENQLDEIMIQSHTEVIVNQKQSCNKATNLADMMTDTPERLSMTTSCDKVDHEEEVSTENVQEETHAQKKPRTEKGMGNSENWNKNVQKHLRMESKPYKGLKRVDGKSNYSEEKSERILCERSCTNRCHKIRGCHKIREETRKEIFKSFWENMDWSEKKVYAVSLIDKYEALKTTVDDSRRRYSYRYFLRQGDQRIQVCKNLFLSTLGIGEYTLYGWAQNVNDHGLPGVANHHRRNTRDQEAYEHAKLFFDSLPKLPSHYCRASSSKMYLEPLFTSFADVYREYETKCNESNKKPVVAKVNNLQLTI